MQALTYAEYVAREPRLTRLWELCQLASPPVRADDDDELDTDPAEGWCAEDYFGEAVKPQLVALVGIDRLDGPPELQTAEAYKTVYATLLQRALRRPCACCREATNAS